VKKVVQLILLSFCLSSYTNRNDKFDCYIFSATAFNDTTQTAEISFTLTKRKSELNFDYYQINLENNSDTAVYFIYDPSAFNPDSKNGNELSLGSYNENEKQYSAILYNMDHLEISEVFKIAPYKRIVIYVKWNTRYRDWKKELYLEYAKPDKNGHPVIGSQMKNIVIGF
jgi:hypothetical protein